MSRMWMGALLVGVGLLGGCAKDREWGGPVMLMSAEAPSSMGGRWEGNWQSNVNYDRGLAHVVVTEVVAPADSMARTKPHFEARFKLWHYEVAPEEFSVLLTATPGTDGKINFYGERTLGAEDGLSKFDGYVENNKLFVTFTSRRDYGTMALRHLAH